MFKPGGRARRVTILSILSASCLLVACSQPANNAEPTPVLSGAPSTAFPMPPVGSDWKDLGWTLADGKRALVSDQHGKVMVLDLYATWCQPCRQSIPHLIKLHQRYESQGLALVGLNVGGADDRVRVPDFAAEYHITYPLGFPDKSLSDLLLSDNDTIPQTFVFARDGRMIKRYIGYDDSMAESLDKLIQAELAVETK